MSEKGQKVPIDSTKMLIAFKRHKRMLCFLVTTSVLPQLYKALSTLK